MTDIEIPVTTVWDIIAGAMDDPWFLLVTVVVVIGTSLIIRRRHNRYHGYRRRP